MLKSIKKFAALCLLATLFIPQIILAETLPGYDVLGLAKYCDTYLKAPPLPAVSTLLSTFGDPLPCIEKRIQRGGLQVVQIDLIDATCWRNNKCPPGVPRPDDLKAIKKRAALVNPMAVKHPDVEFWLSPGLEHDVQGNARVSQMMEAARAGCPTCKVINSPFTGARPPKYKIEKHGTKVSAFSVSGDGASIFDADNLASDGKLNEKPYEHRISGSFTTFAWWNELNLRCTGEKDFTPPMQRKERPTLDQFRQAWMSMQPEPPKPAAPAQCAEVSDVLAPEILKPNGESYCNAQANQNDSRSNRPLLLIKKKGTVNQRLPILAPDGREVGCFKYFGPFTDGKLQRWYEGSCSGLDPAALSDKLGGEWGFVALGGGRCLRFNAVRRQGVYR